MSQQNECEHSDYKLCFKLKQHTPIIHFQAEQKGATLRATELKPKLDRFLLTKLGNGDYDAGVKEARSKGWLIGKEEHPALDYKVIIVSQKENYNIEYKTYLSKRDRRFNNKRLGAYFGELKAIEFKNREVIITISSFHIEMIKEIESLFEEFITVTNFGSRQNKGFGSFTRKETINHKELLEKKYHILLSFESNKPLEDILNLYQISKSGRSYNYKSSKLMEYFYKKNIRWDKRWIKKQLKEVNIEMFNDLYAPYYEENTIDLEFNEDEKYNYIRALLGIGENIEFITKSSKEYEAEINKKREKLKNEQDEDKQKSLKTEIKILLKKAKGAKLIVKYSEKSGAIKRFQSPITFKVINKKVFVLVDEFIPINTNIFNKEFEFKAYFQKDKDNKSKHISFRNTLYVPEAIDKESMIELYKTIFEDAHKEIRYQKNNNKKKSKKENFNNPFAELKGVIS